MIFGGINAYGHRKRTQKETQKNHSVLNYSSLYVIPKLNRKKNISLQFYFLKEKKRNTIIK